MHAADATIRLRAEADLTIRLRAEADLTIRLRAAADAVTQSVDNGATTRGA